MKKKLIPLSLLAFLALAACAPMPAPSSETPSTPSSSETSSEPSSEVPSSEEPVTPSSSEEPSSETPSSSEEPSSEEPSIPSSEPSSEEPSSSEEEPSSETPSSSEEPSIPSSSEEEPSSEDPSSEDPSEPSEDPIDPSIPSEDPSEPSEDPVDPSIPSEDPSTPSEEPSTIKDVYFRAPANWGKSVNIYLWDKGGTPHTSWPGTAMEVVEDGLYKFNYDVAVWTNVIFNDGTKQTADLKSPTDDNVLFVYGKGWTTLENSEEPEELPSGWYIVGEGSFVNGPVWNAEGGIYLVDNPDYEGEGKEYKALDVKFEAGDLWKICSTSGTWVEQTYEGFAFNDGHLAYNSNVEVKTTGIYDIYFKDYGNNSYAIWAEYNAPASPNSDEQYLKDTIVSTLALTNGTIDMHVVASYQGQTQTQSGQFFTDGKIATMYRNGQGMTQEGEWPLSSTMMEFTFGDITSFTNLVKGEKEGEYTAEKITLTLSAKKYAEYRGLEEGTYEFKNDGFEYELSNVSIIIKDGYLQTLIYTGASLGVSGSGVNDYMTYEFNVRTEYEVTYTYIFSDLGTTIVPIVE